MIIKNVVRSLLNRAGFDLSRYPSMLPEHPRYPEFSQVYQRIQQFSLVTADRAWVLYSLALQASSVAGDFWECGVYRGGTAHLLAEVLTRENARKKLHLFDTFTGMPETDPTKDLHQPGDFANTS